MLGVRNTELLQFWLEKQIYWVSIQPNTYYQGEKTNLFLQNVLFCEVRVLNPQNQNQTQLLVNVQVN